ncbi:uncharacterized protein LOC112568063 [Pomacea canaliculata]|uniref:uncharacterized protein LOC112568063 n=1 Tax=Pomacea canaliculata TaxID=400727 RepID=UPI000D73E9A8|nr:uncharacterized protein LOC112568063 [Pomacea canaliculata]
MEMKNLWKWLIKLSSIALTIEGGDLGTCKLEKDGSFRYKLSLITNKWKHVSFKVSSVRFDGGKDYILNCDWIYQNLSCDVQPGSSYDELDDTHFVVHINSSPFQEDGGKYIVSFAGEGPVNCEPAQDIIRLFSNKTRPEPRTCEDTIFSWPLLLFMSTGPLHIKCLLR